MHKVAEETVNNLEKLQFVIRLGDIKNHQSELTEQAMRIIEHRYASMYLEFLNIHPTIKNINLLLKDKPFSKCRVEAIGNDIIVTPNGDKTEERKKLPPVKHTLRIAQKNETIESKFSKFNNQFEGMVKNLRRNLTAPVGIGVYNEHNDDLTNDPDNQNNESQEDGFVLNFDLQSIKEKYLNKLPPKKKTLRGARIINKQRVIQGGVNHQLNGSENNVYRFDFEKFSMTERALIDLQKPLDFKPNEIQQANLRFLKDFPFMHIPIINIREIIKEKKVQDALMVYKDDKKRYVEKDYIAIQMQHYKSSSKFHLVDIQNLINLISSPDVLKMTGIMIHLVYWTIFGHITPAQIDGIQRKQMLVLLLTFYRKQEIKYKVFIN